MTESVVSLGPVFWSQPESYECVGSATALGLPPTSLSSQFSDSSLHNFRLCCRLATPGCEHKGDTDSAEESSWQSVPCSLWLYQLQKLHMLGVSLRVSLLNITALICAEFQADCESVSFAS